MKYVLVGKSLPHSISPTLHNMLGNFSYGIKELADEQELERFVRSHECLGYNVTIPYKQAVMRLLDEIDDVANRICAVNTVVDMGGKLVGYNTDIGGVELAFRTAEIDVKGKNVLILGSGGTCKTVKYFLETHGVNTISIVSRAGELNYSNVYERQDTQIVVNTTPVGTMSIERPLDLSRFEKLEGVFDVIYNPIETALVRQAKKLGLKAIGGLIMLVEQGRAAHNLFAVGNKELKFLPDEQVAFDIAKKLEDERRNIVLVGMAGCGKSTIGRQLAQKLGKTFVDIDEEIEKREGKTIPEIFKEKGEAYFREVEHNVVADACVKSGQVIATGGGAVLDEKNVEWMKANGKIVWIKRDIARLATDGRPLSKDLETVKNLYARREPIYKAICDCEIENNAALEDAIVDLASRVQS